MRTFNQFLVEMPQAPERDVDFASLSGYIAQIPPKIFSDLEVVLDQLKTALERVDPDSKLMTTDEIPMLKWIDSIKNELKNQQTPGSAQQQGVPNGQPSAGSVQSGAPTGENPQKTYAGAP